MRSVSGDQIKVMSKIVVIKKHDICQTKSFPFTRFLKVKKVSSAKDLAKLMCPSNPREATNDKFI